MTSSDLKKLNNKKLQDLFKILKNKITKPNYVRQNCITNNAVFRKRKILMIYFHGDFFLESF